MDMLNAAVNMINYNENQLSAARRLDKHEDGIVECEWPAGMCDQGL